MKRKILHITQSVGGIETYILNILANIDRDRFEMSLICPLDSGGLSKRASDLDVAVYRVRMRREISPFYDLQNLFEISGIVRKIKPDLIHAHSSKAGILGRIAAVLNRIPVIYTPNAYAFLGSTGFKRAMYLLIEIAIRPFTSLLLAVGQSEYERSVHDVRFPLERVRTVENAIKILETPTRLETSPGSVPLVLMVGRLNYQKNPEMFVRAAHIVANQVPNAEFRIIGGGYQEFHGKLTRNLVASLFLKERLKILNWMDQDSLVKLMERAQVIVVPSRYDGLPFLVLEAMAMGKPVVGTRVDGVKDAIADGETGFLVELDDVKSMAERIILLLKDPELRSRLGNAGWKRVEREFNIEKNIRRIENIYCEVSTSL